MYEVSFYELEGKLEIRELESNDFKRRPVCYCYGINKGNGTYVIRATPEEAIAALVENYRKIANDLFEKYNFYEQCINKIDAQRINNL